MNKLNVLIADDHRIVREGLSSLLSGLRDIEVIGHANDGLEAVSLASSRRPDLILMDVTMPVLNGVEATRQILAENPSLLIIALSAHADRKFVAEMFRIGARGYLLKGAPFEELVKAIETVTGGRRFIDPEMTDQVLEDYSRQLSSDQCSELDVLTARERQVLQLLSEGLTTREIAKQLFVSQKTIETHRRALFTKLDVNTVAELTRIAIREGLTSLEFREKSSAPSFS